MSKLLPDWIGEVKQSHEGDSLAQEVKKSISEARGGQDGWEEEEGVLRKKGRLYFMWGPLEMQEPGSQQHRFATV